jgi:hypothetical protein
MSQPRELPDDLEDLSTEDLKALAKTLRKSHLENPESGIDKSVVTVLLLDIRAILEKRAEEQ